MAQGGQRKLRNGLTPKQDKFKKIILKQIKETGGMNATEAAAQAYEVKNRNVARSLAAENLAKPALKQTIEESLNAMGVSQDTFLREISVIAQAPDVKVTADVKLKANLSMIKLLGGFNKAPQGAIKQTTETLTFDEASKSIKRITQELSIFEPEVE